MKNLLLFLLFLQWSISTQAQFSIEQLLSASFPTDLTASADGTTLAWVFNDQGARNLFVADGEGFANVRQITGFKGDEGLELGELTFTPDGRKMVFVSGNGNNNRGEAANPAQLQQETGVALFVVEVSGGKSTRIAAGSSPRISPDGSTVAFLQKGQVWTASLVDTTQKPKQLFQARGGQSSLRWRPDGKKLAFLSGRGDHAFIGIYDMTTGQIQYPDPSADSDSDPAWSPDGQSLAYVRRPNLRAAPPFMPRREGHPWSIRILTAETGQSREVWQADPGPGSVFVRDLPVTENKLAWTADGRLIFPWEKSGWVHLYALNIQREIAKPLTWGDGEIENVVLSPDGQTIYYTTNVDDINRRHIWSVNTREGTPELLTPGDQIEWSPVVTAGGSLAMLRSSATRPAWPALWQQGKVRDLAAKLFPKDYPATLVKPQAVTIAATDGMRAPAQIFLPPGHREGDKHPAVIFLHGGSRRQMLAGFHYSSYYSNAYALNQYFASRGYVVLALNYRSGIGYGLNFREAPEYGITGASEVRDLFGAGEYLKNRPEVDGDRISLWGGSYGGYLTAHGLAQRGDLFATGVDIHGVHNWNDELPTFAPWYDSTQYSRIGQLAFQSSPMNYVDGWKNPVLFIHGDDDRNVPFSETVHLVEQLRRQQVYFEQLVFPDEVHGFLLHRNWLKAYQATFEFIERRGHRK